MDRGNWYEEEKTEMLKNSPFVISFLVLAVNLFFSLIVRVHHFCFIMLIRQFLLLRRCPSGAYTRRPREGGTEEGGDKERAFPDISFSFEGGKTQEKDHKLIIPSNLCVFHGVYGRFRVISQHERGKEAGQEVEQGTLRPFLAAKGGMKTCIL